MTVVGGKEGSVWVCGAWMARLQYRALALICVDGGNEMYKLVVFTSWDLWPAKNNNYYVQVNHIPSIPYQCQE